MMYGCKNDNEKEAQKKNTENQTNEVNYSKTEIRVGSLKGTTSIGLVSLMNEAKEGNTKLKYADFTVAAAADELTAEFIKGNLDIVLVPANVASVLYNKTNYAEPLCS